MTYLEWLTATGKENTQANVEEFIGSLQDQGYDPGDVDGFAVTWDDAAEILRAGADAAAAGVEALASVPFFFLPDIFPDDLGDILPKAKNLLLIGLLAAGAVLFLLVAIRR